jgi:type I restriction enzyme S subunit
MKRYTEYNDSRIEWIGEIPSDWKICKAKYVFQDGETGIKIGPFGSAIKGKTLEDGPYVIYNQAHLIQNDFSLSRHFVSEDTYNTLSSYIVTPGDVLFSMMGTIGKCKIMPVGERPGIMDSHLLKARLNDKISPRFFEYVYDKDNSNIVIQQLLYNSNGTIMNGLNSSIVKNAFIPLPSIKTQQSIVSFLDRKTAAIDKLIADKQKLVELLHEKRQAIISEAVSKGLDKNAPMKDSGIEWIGVIPLKWEVKKLNYLCVKIGDVDHKMPESADDGIPYISPKDFTKDKKIDFEHAKKISKQSFEEISKKIKPQNGDLIFARYATLGVVRIVDVDFDFLVSYSCAIIKHDKTKTNNKYLYYFLKSSYVEREVEFYVNANTQANIGIDLCSSSRNVSKRASKMLAPIST